MAMIPCPGCGHPNEVKAERLMASLCSSCGEKLVEEQMPYEPTANELESSLEERAAEDSPQDVDIQRWLVKIGDQDKQIRYVEEGFWAKVKRYAAKVPFAREVVALYYCSIDPNTPISAKATAVGALAYWILPIDLIPDFLPAAGFVDDATAVLLAYKSISAHITDEHREKAEQFFVLNKNVKLSKPR